MAQIKLRGRLDTFYKVRVVFIVSFVVSFMLTTKIGQNYIPNSSLVTNNIVSFYSNSNILNFYGTIMGLLMAAYTVLISMIPIFHPDSLKQPIFGQINRLFVFTIMIGLASMLLNFASFIVNKSSQYFLFIEVFLFIALITGIIFSVLSLSDIFNILRGKKISRELPRETGKRGSRINQESEKDGSAR
ncbi:hypothetical protein ACNF42_00220 [Cuniculiplasma sp. SKW3]|uniref:hypothetical protein n=1 Tax=Cuniculiplasma sp. SKW3 TaxID=3400170 RepID=UPI003FD3E3C7